MLLLRMLLVSLLLVLLLFLLINRQLLLQLFALCCCLFKLRLLWLSLCNSSGISCALSLTLPLSLSLFPPLFRQENKKSFHRVPSLSLVYNNCSNFVAVVAAITHTLTHMHTHTDTCYACVCVLRYFMYACYNL